MIVTYSYLDGDYEYYFYMIFFFLYITEDIFSAENILDKS